MPDNPQAAWFALIDHRLMALTGRDAVAFAQAQFMNDVAALRDGDWQWNGWLTPKGRVVALFALLRIDAETLWLVSQQEDAETLAMALRRFVFRSKVAIALPDDARILGRLKASERASAAHWAETPDGGVELDLSGDGGGRVMRIVLGPDTATSVDDTDARAVWMRLDLLHGWPRLDTSQREQWTPQQLSLERLNAFSVKKGCYPGQEIVARTHFLGQAKRALARIESLSPLAPGDALAHGDRTYGTVVSAVGDTALAVVATDDARPSNDESPAWGGASWRIEPLLEGLRR